MTTKEYENTGINAFLNLEDLLKTRREAMYKLVSLTNEAQDKATAYGALKAVRIHFDKAVLDELGKIIESHKAVGLLEKSQPKPDKPKMTEEQKNLTTCFNNALVNLKKYVVPYMERNGIERYTGMANEMHLYGKKLLAEWKNQFEE